MRAAQGNGTRSGDAAKRRRLPNRGFTLLEVLVSLSILTLLATLVLSAVTSVRRRGAQTTCLNNLKQVYGGLALYAQDNDGLLPPFNNDLGRPIPLDQGEVPLPDEAGRLVESLGAYLRTADPVWYCPADLSARRDVRRGKINHRWTSYRYLGGYWPGSGDRPTPIDAHGGSRSQRGPSELVVFTDNVWHCKDNRGWRDQSEYSHGGRYNALFFDGHLRDFRLEDPTCR